MPAESPAPSAPEDPQPQPGEARREQRFALNSNTKLPVTISREGESDETGTAVDISFSGAKIKVKSAVAPKSEIDVAIEGTNETRKAQVCWSRPAPGGAWWVGCRFEEKLPLEVIDGLANEGYLDRRQDDRRLMSVAGTARYELGSEQHDVQLVNMSVGGFSLVADDDPGESGRLMLTVRGRGGKPTTVPARIAWSKEIHGGYQMGCQFATRDSYQRLHQALVKPRKSVLSNWRPRQDRSRTAILVALLVMTWGLWMIAK